MILFVYLSSSQSIHLLFYFTCESFCIEIHELQDVYEDVGRGQPPGDIVCQQPISIMPRLVSLISTSRTLVLPSDARL